MSGTSLAKYETARRAVSAARHDLASAASVQEVTDIRSKAEGIRAYARAAKDRSLEIDAAEIHFHAARRLGHMISEQKATVGLAKGTAGKGRPKKGGSRKDPPKDLPTLAEVGIDKHLAHEARTMGALSDDLFEELIRSWRKQAEAGRERVTINLLRAASKATKGDQLALLDLSAFYLSGSGQKLVRVREQNELAPDWLKLANASDAIITTMIEGIRKLAMRAKNIGKAGGVVKFQKEFNQMEARITERANEYWHLRKLIASMQSAGISIEPEPEPEYDAELERRGLWAPKSKISDSDDGVPF